MTTPIATQVRVAATPEQAKVFVALLRAEGIPAHVDGDSLADEFALSRRLMNLQGVRVMVPTASLERAREILATEAIDETELEQQALAAEAPERSVPSVFAAQPPRGKNPLLWPFVGACGVAVVFFVLWFDHFQVSAAARDPLFDFVVGEAGSEPGSEPGRANSIRRTDGTVAFSWHDPDLNLIWDRVDFRSPDGTLVYSNFDEDQDGIWERCITFRGDVQETWSDDDHDGRMDSVEVTDANGTVVQRLAWKAGVGFVIEKP